MSSFCESCFEKQQKIDRLEDRVRSLEAQLKYRTKRQLEGFFGSSTPSAKLPVKPNVAEKKVAKPKGARAGHAGHGRQAFDESTADAVVDVRVESCHCPHCGSTDLADAAGETRSVLESAPIKAAKVVQRLHGKVCRTCGRRMVAKPKGVLPKCLVGNQLLTNAVTMHYEHGIPLARVLEVKAFVSTLAPLLATAMALRGQPISDEEYYRRAAELERLIRGTAEAPAQDLGIRRIQDIFRDNEKRLYHWVQDRRVAAENNRAERDLRPTVIARKVSFGSQSEAGAQSRSVLMSVLHTMRKRGAETGVVMRETLDALAENPKQDPYPLLFPQRQPASSSDRSAETQLAK